MSDGKRSQRRRSMEKVLICGCEGSRSPSESPPPAAAGRKSRRPMPESVEEADQVLDEICDILDRGTLPSLHQKPLQC